MLNVFIIFVWRIELTIFSDYNAKYIRIGYAIKCHFDVSVDFTMILTIYFHFAGYDSNNQEQNASERKPWRGACFTEYTV